MAGAIEFLGTSRDWLDARIPVKFREARQWLGLSLGEDDPLEDFDPPQKTGYRAAAKPVDQNNFGKLSLLGEHPQSMGWSMLQATGGAAPWAYSTICNAAFGRSAQANRVDIALDFLCSQRKFDRLFTKGRAICLDHGRRPHPVGEDEYGRTLYFNWAGKRTGVAATAAAKAPQYAARLYEKGKEQGQNPEWRRFEVTCRPDKPAFKERAFHADPGGILAAPMWSRAFLDVLGYNEATPLARSSAFKVEVSGSRQAKEARAMWTVAHLGDQYGRAARDLADMIGKERVMEMVRMSLFEQEAEATPLRPALPAGPDRIRQAANRLYAGLYQEIARHKQANAPASWGMTEGVEIAQEASAAKETATSDKFRPGFDFWGPSVERSALANGPESQVLQ